MSDGEIEDAQSERAEDSDIGATVARRSTLKEDVAQSTPDEISLTRQLLGQMNRCLRAADVVYVVHDVVAGEDYFRR